MCVGALPLTVSSLDLMSYNTSVISLSCSGDEDNVTVCSRLPLSGTCVSAALRCLRTLDTLLIINLNTYMPVRECPD